MHVRVKGCILLAAVVLALSSVGLCAAGTGQKEAVSSLPAESYYLLKDYHGTLAIFSSDNEQPIELLEVQIDSLPERDITRLKQGIRADTLEQARSLAEDYE